MWGMGALARRLSQLKDAEGVKVVGECQGSTMKSSEDLQSKGQPLLEEKANGF